MFRLFTPLFTEFDSIIATFSGTVSSKVMVAITPVLACSLTLWFTVWGIMVMRGTVQEPIRDFLWRVIRSSVILSFAIGGGYYQSTVAEVVRSVPDDLAAVVMGGDAGLYWYGDPEQPLFGSGGGQGALIDVAAGKGIAAAMDGLQKGSILSEDGFVCLACGLMLLCTTILMVGVGGAIILVAKLVLGLLVALGPIFIAALLFDATRKFFERWVAMVVTYGLLIVLFAVVFTFMLGVFQRFVTGVKFDGVMNVGYGVAGAAILAIVSFFMLKEARVLAMGLGGGFTLGPIRHAISVPFWHRRGPVGEGRGQGGAR